MNSKASTLSVHTGLAVEEPEMEGRPKPYEDETLVDFDGLNDPLKPLNWPMKKKIVVTGLYSLCTMGTTWASTMLVSSYPRHTFIQLTHLGSSYNSGLIQVEHQFNVSQEVALLGLTLYLLGYSPSLRTALSLKVLTEVSETRSDLSYGLRCRKPMVVNSRF